MNTAEVEKIIVSNLEDSKALDIQVLDVRKKCSFTDTMIVATGTSTTHVKSTGNTVAKAFKDIGNPALGVESSQDPEWVLIDLGVAVVHVMTKAARERYQLEKLWSFEPTRN
jgi:ribosome-associated protein